MFSGARRAPSNYTHSVPKAIIPLFPPLLLKVEPISIPLNILLFSTFSPTSPPTQPTQLHTHTDYVQMHTHPVCLRTQYFISTSPGIDALICSVLRETTPKRHVSVSHIHAGTLLHTMRWTHRRRNTYTHAHFIRHSYTHTHRHSQVHTHVHLNIH